MNIVDLRGKLPVHKTKRYSTRNLSDIRSYGIHHSLTKTGSPQAFAGYHVGTNDWPEIAYAYVIQQDGTIYWCLDWRKISYHVGSSNKHSLGICLVGDYRSQQPTPEQYASAIKLIRWLQPQIPTAQEILGHSEYPGYAWKACPVISMDKFRTDVAAPAAIAPKYPAARVFVNGQEVANGLLIGDRVYAPLRAVGEAAGAVVGWDHTSKTANIDGRPVAGLLIDAVTHVALRAAGEAVGGTVMWDGASKTATIICPPATFI